MSGIMVILVLVVFFMTLAFKLGPSYMGFMTLRSIMDKIAESPEPIVGGRPAILKALDSSMMVNDVRDMDPKAFTVTKSGENTFDLTVEYEQRTHLFANVDAVLSFNHAVAVKGQ